MNIQNILKKPRYNNEELKKAIDVTVDELVPPSKRKRLDLVPRERFDAVVVANDELNEELAALGEQLSALETEISELENQIEQAEITTDEARLAQSVAENRAAALQDQFQQLNADFREALQKSIQEGINKLSLQSQNDGLRAEVNALRTDLAILQATTEGLEGRLEGRDAEVAAGADLLGTTTTIRNLQPNPNTRPVRLWYKRGESARNDSRWEAGERWRVRNSGEERIEIRVEINGTENAILPPTNPTFALEPNETRDFDLRKNISAMNSAAPTTGFFTSSQDHNGSMTVTLLSTGESLTFPARFRKRR